MATVSPSKFMSLSYLKNLANNWHTGKNGKEYEIEEVNSLIWEKEANIKHGIYQEIPKAYRIENLEDNELESLIHEIFSYQNETIDGFTKNDFGDLLTESYLRSGKYDNIN